MNTPATTEKAAEVKPPKPPTITYKNGLTDPRGIDWPELSFDQLYELAELCVAGRTPAIVALCADRKSEWVESLTHKSFAACAAYCVGVNFPLLETLAESDPILNLKIGPLRLQLKRLSISAVLANIESMSAIGSAIGAAWSPPAPPAAAAVPTPAPSPASPAASSPSGPESATAPTPATPAT